MWKPFLFMSTYVQTLTACIIALTLSSSDFAQTKKKSIAVKGVPPVVAQPVPQPEPIATPVRETPKRNVRPGLASPASKSDENARNRADGVSYRYEFTQPEFLISKLVIEHDDRGKGTITFQRRDSEEEISDPITLSPVTLERIKGAYAALNFLESAENYQYEKDYSHLGNALFTVKFGSKSRTAKFNFTQNKDAKTLADEYRKIGYQFVWIFDITFARENQPLNAPRLMDSLDILMKRNEISDPPQMKDLLISLSDDERIPLIARNHAARLIKWVEKGKK